MRMMSEEDEFYKDPDHMSTSEARARRRAAGRSNPNPGLAWPALAWPALAQLAAWPYPNPSLTLPLALVPGQGAA